MCVRTVVLFVIGLLAIPVSGEEIEPPMANMDRINRKFFSGVYKGKKKLIAILDISILLDL